MCPKSRTCRGAYHALRSFRCAACERRWARFTLLGSGGCARGDGPRGGGMDCECEMGLRVCTRRVQGVHEAAGGHADSGGART
jgi:hypothetical protein